MELRRARLRGCVLALVLSGVGRPVAAQEEVSWRIASARMEADLTRGDGSASVSMSWVLVAWPEGSPIPPGLPIPVELLGFGEATSDEVMLDDGRIVRLEPDHGSHRSAVLRPTDDTSGDALEVGFSYVVPSAVELRDGSARARIPVLTGPTPAEASRQPVDAGRGQGGASGPTLFAVTLHLPDEWRIADGFPSGLRRGEDGRYSVALPVPPAMVGFRARTDGAWRPGLPLLIDILIVCILLGFAAFGWRHLRSLAA